MNKNIEILQRIVELREADQDDPLSFSSIAQILNQEFPGIGATKDAVQKIHAKGGWLRPVKRRKVVVLGDVHASPDPALTEMILAEKPDLTVIGGDLLDSSQINQHSTPNEKCRLLKEEMETCRTWLKSLPGQKWVVRGNHDHWWEYQASEWVPDDLMYLVQDPLDLTTRGIPDTTLVEMPLSFHMPDGTSYETTKTKYMYIVGDVLISHGNFTSKNAGGAVLKLKKWVDDWRRPLAWPDFSLLIQCHGHKLSYAEMEGGWLSIVEPGMAGIPSVEAYKLGYQTKWGPSSIGATVFEQEQKSGKWLTCRSTIRLLRPHR